MKYTIEAACGSHMGKCRHNNEDNFYFDGLCMEERHDGTHNAMIMEQPLSQGLCFAVFDGIGGLNYGETASFSAAKAMQCYIDRPKEFYISEKRYLQRMTEYLNDSVFAKADELVTNSIGTTMAALFFTPRQVYCCNIGDSRIFRLRDFVFSQLSEDHISRRPLPEGNKPPLTQYLGMDPHEIRIEPYIAKGELQSGDIYLICTDGLTDMVSNVELMNILQSKDDPAEAVEKLIKEALQNGGKDNITVICCRII